MMSFHQVLKTWVLTLFCCRPSVVISISLTRILESFIKHVKNTMYSISRGQNGQNALPNTMSRIK